jgi:alkyl hydroperoxide reductase subunit AhpF
MAEPILNDTIRQQVRDALAGMKEPVQILFFGSQQDCPACSDTRQLVEEVTGLSDKLGLSIYDIGSDAAIAGQYHVDKVPGLVIAAKDGGIITDYGIRLSGIPSGHEFTTLIQDILFVSGRDSGLSAATRQFLKSLEKPVHLQVFVTPT